MVLKVTKLHKKQDMQIEMFIFLIGDEVRRKQSIEKNENMSPHNFFKALFFNWISVDLMLNLTFSFLPCWANLKSHRI